MRYKLIDGSLNDISKIQETVMRNRGIQDIQSFTHITDKNEHPYELLEHIKEAVKILRNAVEKQEHIHIIVDCDVDGYTSAAILYQYLEKIGHQGKLTYSIHTEKQHGLSNDIQIPEDVDLLVVPDAGTNDVEQCKELSEKGIRILILDHHKAERNQANQYACIVNNQTCDYPNKYLSGVGVAYKFLQAYDELNWFSYADDFVDLVMLGLISDNMDVRELENQFYIQKGLHKIRNGFLKALLKKQEYSIREDFETVDIQFYITPLINGMIRAGDMDEKDLMFQAFIQHNQIFEYKKRGGEIEQETIYDRCARLCFNARQRQKKYNDKHVENIVRMIKEKHTDRHKVLFVNITDELEQTMTGVVAIQIANRFQKPCLLLRKNAQNNTYGGSGRNPSNSPIQNFREFLLQLGLFNYVQGHDNAFGVDIDRENVAKAIKLSDQYLKDVDFTPCYYVDFIIDCAELDVMLVRNIDKLRKYYGEKFPSVQIAIENCKIKKKDIVFMSDQKHWKLENENGVFIVKFYDSKMPEYLEQHDCLTTNLVGHPDVNRYKGILSCQFIIDDYEIIKD